MAMGSFHCYGNKRTLGIASSDHSNSCCRACFSRKSQRKQALVDSPHASLHSSRCYGKNDYSGRNDPMRTFNFSYGAMASAWLLTLLVVGAELLEPLKKLLASIFWHHWVGKGILIAITFVVVGYLSRRKSFWNISADDAAWYSVLGSMIIIFLFYLLEFFI